jgi:diguanylate cyclase (GGDEF)-like protein
VLNEIGRIATDDLELQPMLQRIVEALQAEFSWDHLGIARIDLEARTFVCEAVVSRLPSQVTVGYSRGLGSGVVGEVAKTGEPIVLDDVSRYPSYVPTVEGARSELCLPIKHRGRVVGILNIEDSRLDAFHGQLPLLLAIVEQIAGAIASARLYQEIRRRAGQLELASEVSRAALEEETLSAQLARIVTAVQERFHFLLSSVYLVGEDRTRLELGAFAAQTPIVADIDTFPIGEGVIGRTVRERKTQLVLDVDQDPDYVRGAPSRAELAVPILLRDRLLGVLNLESDRPEVFTPDVCTVVEMLARQLAGAIHLAAVNRRLTEATRELEEANARLSEANRALSQMTMEDALTGVANRRRIDQELDIEWRRAIRTLNPLALLLIDIDEFKRYNDALGHQAGDLCLRRVAAALLSAFGRAGDLVARYGGEEFAVLLPNTARDSAAELAEGARRVVERLAVPHPASRVAPVVTVSLGVSAAVPRLGERYQELLADADAALYEAKRGGRNRVRVHRLGEPGA